VACWQQAIEEMNGLRDMCIMVLVKCAVLVDMCVLGMSEAIKRRRALSLV
jgi:hypothetical protein